jgi:uncharacterized protein YdhG (YjbR/CyaY superfamily)
MTIRKAAPDAEETIKYQIPTFTRKDNLVYFAAFKKHIGFYPPAKGDEKLKNEISVYEGAKGNLRFPLDKPIPYALISKIVNLRVSCKNSLPRSLRGSPRRLGRVHGLDRGQRSHAGRGPLGKLHRSSGLGFRSGRLAHGAKSAAR